MKTPSSFVFAITIALAAISLAAQDRGRGAAPAAPPMTLTVAGFADGADIPVKFTQAAPVFTNFRSEHMTPWAGVLSAV